MGRLAINPDWSCDINDPRNARYLCGMGLLSPPTPTNPVSFQTGRKLPEDTPREIH
jgi:hypothetical protein